MQMSAPDLEIEPRSEDESDAGSLVDFVCGDDEEQYVDSEHEDTPVQLVQSAVFRGGARRSTRRRVQPSRYMDPDYVSMMIDDVDIEKVLSDTEDQGAQPMHESEEDQEYQLSQSSSDVSSSDDEEERSSSDESSYDDEEI